MSILLTPRAERYVERTAVITPEDSFTYKQLLDASGKAASFLLDGSTDLQRGRWLSSPPLVSTTWRCSGLSGAPGELPSLYLFSILGRNWNMCSMTPALRR